MLNNFDHQASRRSFGGRVLRHMILTLLGMANSALKKRSFLASHKAEDLQEDLCRLMYSLSEILESNDTDPEEVSRLRRRIMEKESQIRSLFHGY